jgi:hypothetical protein
MLEALAKHDIAVGETEGWHHRCARAASLSGNVGYWGVGIEGDGSGRKGSDTLIRRIQMAFDLQCITNSPSPYVSFPFKL